jgi:hypothetical protein
MAARTADISKTVASDFPVAQATIQILNGFTLANGLQPVAINDSDEIVGNNNGQPFRWTAAGGVQNLATPGTTNGGVAVAVNDNGDVLGDVSFSDGLHAVVWLPDGTMRVFPNPPLASNLPPEAACQATAINIYAQIVGVCTQPPSSNLAGLIYYWHAPTVVSRVAAEYTSISDDGWMGGELLSGGPFVQSPTGQVITLYGHDDSLHTNALVSAVSRHGWAAGQSDEGGCLQAVAWLYQPGQHWPEYRMGVCGYSEGITPDWYVIGQGFDPNFTPSSQFAFVWYPGKGTQRLPSFSNLMTTAIAINAKHHVLGLVGSQVVIWDVAQRS